jgi:hypothetical protein
MPKCAATFTRASCSAAALTSPADRKEKQMSHTSQLRADATRVLDVIERVGALLSALNLGIERLEVKSTTATPPTQSHFSKTAT